MAGGMVRAIVDKRRKGTATEAEFSPGVLLSSGFIAGGAIMGVIVAGLAGAEWDKKIDCSSYLGFVSQTDWVAAIPFMILMFVLYKVGLSGNNKGK